MSERWIAVAGNIDLDLDRVDPNKVDYRSIAHAIGGLERYGGHTVYPWPVADHVAACAVLAALDQAHSMKKFSGDARDGARAALHHDDGEAYYGDVLRPIASFMGSEFKALRRRVDSAIEVKLGLEPALMVSAETRLYDMVMLEAEHQVLFPPGGRPWSTTEEVKESPLLPFAVKLVDRYLGTAAKAGHQAREWRVARLLLMEKLLVEWDVHKTPVQLLAELSIID
jgi:hypothetical protein